MKSTRLKSIARSAALSAVISLMAACKEGVLAPAGPIGDQELTILYDATAVMLAVIIPVMILTLGFAWWFRAGNERAEHLPDWEYSGAIETIVWSIPTLLIVFLGGIAWIASHDLDPPAPIASQMTPLEVEVVSLDWKWLFIYPKEGIASVNQLTLPVGQPVHFKLTSATVMNSFFIPQLGSQIYTMPNMTTQLNLEADKVGVYPGISAQFSGDGFADMRFDVNAVPTDQFKQWVDAAKAKGTVLDNASYTALAHPSQAVAPATYAPVTDGLFGAISSGQASSGYAPPQEN